MRKSFIAGTFNSYELARKLKISTGTAWQYKQEFERIKAEYPDKLNDIFFYRPKPVKEHWATPLYQELVQVLPILVTNETTQILNAMPIWKKYRKVYPNGYTYSPFKIIFKKWIKENLKPSVNYLITHIPDEDLKTLLKWKRSNVHRNWQVATTLKAASEGYTITQIIDKVDSYRPTVTEWIKLYNTKGLDALILKPHVYSEKYTRVTKERKDNLLKILHETPKLHGINRTSWSITALTEVYNRTYKSKATYDQLRACLKELGYKSKKSRDMLTSQDPKFREKLNKIQDILQNLGPKDKFFSIDEYGPVGIRIRGGTMLKHKTEAPRTVPQKQKHKGVVICTAALELSTNQLTYFYSSKKNTFETIKLIEVLLNQYKGQERLYLCWDAASWHKSKILRYFLEDVNDKEYRKIGNTPEVILAPLPSCTQFLNVIESVFAGLAKSVMHNSDYESLDEAKEAIALYFETRNKHFRDNPKHAGNKIWGKEIVAPKFSETQQCRVATSMRGEKSKSVYVKVGTLKDD